MKKSKHKVIIISVMVLSLLFYTISNFTLAATSREDFITSSMTEHLAGLADTKSVAVIPNPETQSGIKEYAGTIAGMKEAMYDIYQYGDGGNYGVYIGTSINVSTLAADSVPATPSATDITFKALKGKAKTLIITSTADDTINTGTTAATGAKVLTFGTSAYFGTDIVLRNISYSGANLYMNGNNLTLGGSSYGSGSAIYGGSKTQDVTGNPKIEISSTGTGIWYIYGGNETGGTLTGNPNVIVHNTSGGINTISGGGEAGTVVGNTALTINDTKGTVANSYGAGEKANLDGNATTKIEINNPSTGFGVTNYYGASYSGDVTGSVSSTLIGNGKTISNFTGGSTTGNIGTNRGGNAITTNLDTSLYTGGNYEFTGGNTKSGIITGNINSEVKAGHTNGKGSIGRFSGAGGFSVSKLSRASAGATNAATYDSYTPEKRAELAKAAADFQVLGDVNLYIKSGSVANSYIYMSGSGYGGYIEGNSTTRLGTLAGKKQVGGEGLVHKGNLPTNISYSNSKNNQGELNGWDVVAAGGTPSANTILDIYIKGNTKLIADNLLAKWTYGGGYSGVVEGNTSYEMNGGIVDTLEGAGYMDFRVYGNSQATVNYGQVDWFLTGAGWSANKIVGNVAVTVYDGVINATMGGTYGLARSNEVTGNAEVTVYGGDFSGRAGGAPETGFAGGPTNLGSILGNSTLTLDLRNYDGEFKLPTGTQITGGVRYSGGGYLGTDDSNTITLNIFTKEGSDVLNGADIYGDGGGATTGSKTKSGHVNINIDAPDSKIGSFYTTQYKNVSSGKLLRDVNANIERIGSIGGITGGNKTDNITNDVAKNSAAANKFVKFNIGVPADGGEVAQKQTEPMDITGIGLVNFTELNIENGAYVRANGGSITNGLNATAANHAKTYNEFGNISIKDGGGLGVVGSSDLISGGELNVSGEADIGSLPGTGKINVSAVNFADDTSKLLWTKIGTTGSLVNSQGTYWGNQDAYQVITVNPTVANAGTMTPFNFTGIEEETGKTFIGDNDVTGTVNGYGLMIPGSIIDYHVEKGTEAEVYQGDGNFFHDVDVNIGKEPVFTKGAWGTAEKGVLAKDGQLFILSSSNILPTLTATPEKEKTGSWLKNMKVHSTKVGATDELFGEKKDDSDQEWKSADGAYSYTLTSMFTNKVELTSRSIILTSEEAKKVTNKADLDKWTEVSGRPFLQSDELTTAELAQLHDEIAADAYRIIPITYKSGSDATNTAMNKVNVIVVGADFTTSDDKHVTLHTNNSLEIKQKDLANYNDTNTWSEFYKDKKYIYGFSLNSDGVKTENVTPKNGTQHLLDLINATSFPQTVTEPYGISVDFNGKAYDLERPVKITVKPNTVFLTINFVDEAGEALYTDETTGKAYQIEVEPGTTLDLTTNKHIQEEIFKGIEDKYLYFIKERPANEQAIVVNDDMAVTYVFNGIIYFASHPETIDFGRQELSLRGNQVGADSTSLSSALVLKDSRRHDSTQPWSLKVKANQALTNNENQKSLNNALKYRKGTDLLTINEMNQEILAKDSRITDINGLNITDAWKKDFSQEGMKVEITNTDYAQIGTYEGEVQWTIAYTSEP